MLHRFLDDRDAPAVREQVGLLTFTRLVENSAYRFAPPFLATIASGLGVSLATMGAALSVTELGGLLSPVLGRLVDGWPRRGTLVASGCVVATGALVAACAPGIVVFTIGLLVLSLAKTVFDLTINAWIADHVPYGRRARVVGIVEMSWAGGLLLGVPILGLATAATNWRAGYAIAAASLIVLLLAVHRRVPSAPGWGHGDEAHPADRHAAPVAVATGAAAAGDPALAPTSHAPAASWLRPAAPVILALVCLMGASQCAFVTFGSWLQDDHRFSSTGLAAVAFALGAGELVASTSTMRLTDRFGKRQAVRYGALLMVLPALALAFGGHRHVVLGLPLLGIYLLGFEFAIVSSLSLSSNLVPGRPGAGIGAAFGAGTLGRGVVSLVGTRLFEAHGFAAPMLLGAALAAACAGFLSLANEPRPAPMAG